LPRGGGGGVYAHCERHEDDGDCHSDCGRGAGGCGGEDLDEGVGGCGHYDLLFDGLDRGAVGYYCDEAEGAVEEDGGHHLWGGKG
jgi:hypothetical protein